GGARVQPQAGVGAPLVQVVLDLRAGAFGPVGGVAGVLGDGEVFVEADLVGQARERDLGAHLPQARAASLFGREVDPDHFDAAGGGPHPAGDGQQQCGAAAAGGAGDGDQVADAGLQV